MMKTRMKAKDRKTVILETAIQLAVVGNFSTITREDVAKAAGCARTLITYYFPTMCELRNEVLKEGIDRKISTLINQGIVHRHKFINGVPKDILNNAVKTLMVD